MKQIKMKKLNVFTYGNAGVKGFEILFQDRVEETLEKNGFNGVCWWQALNHEPIFMTLFTIYKQGDSKDHSIIYEIQKYYDKIKDMTDTWVKNKLNGEQS